MNRILASIPVGSLLFSTCDGGASSAQADAQKAMAGLTGDDRQAAADNPQCKLFTRAEVAKYIGRTAA
jgi:hypothetical protein